MPQPRGSNLTGPLSVSLLLHLGALAAAIWAFRAGPPVVLPPMYKVNIVAAPPGERAIGVVSPEPATPEPATEAPPQMREVKTPDAVVPLTKTPATKAPVKATPTTSKTKTPPKAPMKRAGGGPTGGKGTDVATIQTDGLDFPYPGYLNNIVRQIALNFKPPNPNSPLRAEVRFLIHRNGTVTGFSFITRSGVYSFDLEAQGAIEKAAKSFGPLPEGFRDDVLPVVFSFDPKVWR